jgi:hypothetical protein
MLIRFPHVAVNAWLLWPMSTNADVARQLSQPEEQQDRGSARRRGALPQDRRLASLHGQDLYLLKVCLAQQARYLVGAGSQVWRGGWIRRDRRDAHQPLEVGTDLWQDPPHRRCEPLRAGVV